MGSAGSKVLKPGLRKALTSARMFFQAYFVSYSEKFLSPSKYNLIPFLPQGKALSMEDTLLQSLIITGHNSF